MVSTENMNKILYDILHDMI